MTTYYVNFYQHATADTMVGYFYPTEQEAGSAAGRIVMPPHHRTAVPIEVPDPPHVWKIGDWFESDVESAATYVIVAPYSKGHWTVVVFGPSPGGAFLLDECDPTYINAVPCDPPAWFTEQQATP